MTALLMLTIGIAIMVITNAVALSIVERIREIGVLRAVGMIRRQLRQMIRGEALLIAALAIALGVGLGIALGASTVTTLGEAGPAAIMLPVGQLLLMVTVVTAAGLLPARRAARIDVMDAIAAA